MTDTASLARRIHQALVTGVPIEPPARGTLDESAGYAAQDALLALRIAAGEKLAGVKMAFTGARMQQRLGLAGPATGHLTDAMHVPSGGTLRLGGALRVRVESEVAFLLGADLYGDEDAAALRAAIAGVAPAIEVVGSRYRTFDFELGGALADNTAALAFVTGAWLPLAPEADLRAEQLVLWCNDQAVAQGPASAICGDPLASLARAAQLGAARGRPLARGHVVMAGTATDPYEVVAGDRLRVGMGEYGEARLSLVD